MDPKGRALPTSAVSIKRTLTQQKLQHIHTHAITAQMSSAILQECLFHASLDGTIWELSSLNTVNGVFSARLTRRRADKYLHRESLTDRSICHPKQKTERERERRLVIGARVWFFYILTVVIMKRIVKVN